ncbi:MAG: hypothetical protein ACJAVR_002805 [Paracoccaceae bacterium]|jgi:hypothetical protein
MRLAALLLTSILAAPAAAQSPGPCIQGPGVVVSVCPGAGRADILLLPEDVWRMEGAPAGTATVTGAYTGPDMRVTGAPKPVGVFIVRGERISLELARMDGLLVTAPDGSARISTVRDAQVGGQGFDLRTLTGRVAFARRAEETGASAFQSHLLVRDGALDLRAVDGAPVARRRVLFQLADGALAIWQSGDALTLHQAAAALMAAHAPVMALNLDMGGHDFCEIVGPEGPAPCGLLTRGGMGRMSNVLRLTPG